MLLPVPRHHRVWLRPGLALQDVQGPGGLLAAQRLLDWVDQQRPLVARAPLPADPPGSVALGLALVADDVQRSRLAFTVAAAQVSRVEPPLLLTDAMPMLPAAMQPVAAALVAQAAAIAVAVHVYGSVAWQHAAGGGYLHAASDLDVLLRPADQQQLDGCLALLARVQAATPLRIDGELQMPGGDAVAWRELAGTPRQLLVKGPAAPRLMQRDAVRAAWPDRVCAPC